MGTELQTRTGTELREIDEPMTCRDLLVHVALIQDVMKAVMKSGEHYGVIPGCGDKPTLLQPGAQKLALTFRLAPKVIEREEKETGEHLECVLTIALLTRNGQIIAEGIGSCSTKENKYRYRWENTQRPVPGEYWKTRNSALIGGPDYSTRKIKGSWFIFHRVEHDNPTDYYNTVRKMAFKRAMVHAVLQGTAASDIFTQDVEDMRELLGGDDAQIQRMQGDPSDEFGAEPDRPHQSYPKGARAGSASQPAKDRKPKGTQDGATQPPKPMPAAQDVSVWNHFQLEQNPDDWPVYFLHEVHFGEKTSGLRIGELSMTAFDYFLTKWHPEEPTNRDEDLYKALQLCNSHGE